MLLDVLSDLHVDRWDKKIEWEGLPSSFVAVIAGDVSTDIDISYKTVVEIAKYYRHVIFVDGNHEHANSIGISNNNKKLHEKFSTHSNITFLYKNTIVLDDVAFVGANGWWSYDFSDDSRTDCFEKLLHEGWPKEILFEQFEQAQQDSLNVRQIVELFDKDPAVRKIVLVTHTVPSSDFRYISNNDIAPNYGRNGSIFMNQVFTKNLNNKICTWIFGHVHKSYDIVKDGIHYVSNPRGLPGQNPAIYYPKIIKI